MPMWKTNFQPRCIGNSEEKEKSFQQMLLKKLATICTHKKENFNPYFILHTKINSKWIADPNEIPKTAKLLKENKDKKYLQPQAKFS